MKATRAQFAKRKFYQLKACRASSHSWTYAIAVYRESHRVVARRLDFQRGADGETLH